MIISLISAMEESNGIGYKNTLPWRQSEDLKRFKAITLGKPVIMGRKTWESLGVYKPLPGRTNIVITRNSDYQAEGGEVVSSLADAAKLAEKDGAEEAFVIGGGEIYKLALEIADRLYITRLDAPVVHDAKFPEFNLADWELVNKESHESDGKNDYDYSFLDYHRKA